MTVKHLKGIRQVLVIYPYVVAGGFTVAKKNRQGHYDAQFGLITPGGPTVCEQGLRGAPTGASRSDTGNRPMKTNVGCTDPTQDLPRRREGSGQPHRNGLQVTGGDVRFDRLARWSWSDQDPSANIAYDGGAAKLFGEDSWKWMLLQPSLPDNQE